MVEELRKKGELYNFTQVRMAYATLRLNGEKITQEEVEHSTDKEVTVLYDLFDYILDNYDKPVNRDFLQGCAGAMGLNGEYREFDSTRDKIAKVAKAETIPEKMDELLARPMEKYSHLTRFLYDFEKIRPFGDATGAIGRAVVYKECLRLGIEPVVVTVAGKMSMYNLGLRDDFDKFSYFMMKSRTRYNKDTKQFL